MTDSNVGRLVWIQCGAAADNSAGMAMLVAICPATASGLDACRMEKNRQTRTRGYCHRNDCRGHNNSLQVRRPGTSLSEHAGIICYYACGIVKEKLGVDDSLDVAAVHGVGGILGTLLVSYLGVEGTFGGLGINKETAAEQLNVQAQGCIAAIALSVVATFLIVKFVGAITGGIRVSEDDETKGLDQSAHGENGYSLN